MGLPSGLYTFVGGATPAASDWNTNPTVFKNILSGNVDQDNVTTSGSKGVLTIADTQTITGTKTFTVTNTSGIATFTSQSVHTGGLKSGSSIISDTTNTDTLGTSAVTWADLYLGNGAVAYFGEDQDVSLTHTVDTGLHLNAGMKLGFRDLGGEYIYSVADGTLGIVAATELDITTTTVDINGALDVSGNIVSGGEIDAVTLDISGNADIDGIANLDNTDIDGTLAVDGTTISLDATTSLNIDNSNTSNGITIGTATSGVPVSIGHTVSEVTVNDNLTVTGTLASGVATIATGSTIGNLTFANGSITDSSGAITFVNENLATTGTLAAGVATLATGSTIGNLTLADGSITDSSGSITFVNENLATTGTLSAGVATLATGSTIGNLTFANGSITDSSGSISMGDENLALTGQLLLGNSTAQTIVSVVPKVQVEGLGYTNSSISIFNNSNDDIGSHLYIGKSRGTSLSSNTIVQDGDAIGGIHFVAADGTDRASRAAGIFAVVDGTPGANDTPAELLFQTTADGANSPTTRMAIKSNGNVGIGTAAPTDSESGLLLHVKGADANVKVEQSSGTGGFFAYNAGSGDSRIKLGVPEGDWALRLDNSDSDSLKTSWRASGGSWAELMTLTTAGFLGIDVAPAAWHASHSAVVQFGRSALIEYADVQMDLLHNAYYDGAYKKIADSTASRYTQTGGAHSWDTAATGTGTFSWANKMKLLANGNLGLGTAEPASLLHLHTTTSQPTALTISNSNADANAAYLKFVKTSASPADNDMAGLIDFYADNDNATPQETRTALIYSQITDVTDGEEDGNLAFKTMVAGSLNATMVLESGYVNLPNLSASSDVQTDGSKNLVTTSDERLKNADGFIENALSTIEQLTPRYFFWKHDVANGVEARQLGFFSQEVHALIPEAAPVEDDIWGLNTRALVAYLTAAVQELSAKINKLEN